jgi:hypothetical protein
VPLRDFCQIDGFGLLGRESLALYMLYLNPIEMIN